MAYNAQSTGSYSIGPDLSLQVIDLTTGQPIDFGPDFVSFTYTPNIEKYTRNVISGGGRRKMRTRPQGYDGTFVMGRINGSIEKWQIAKAQTTLNTGKEPLYDLVATVKNAIDGSTDVFRWTLCTLNMTGPGEWNLAAGAGVEITFTFEAMDMLDESP